MTDSIDMQADDPTLSEALPAIAALVIGVPSLTGLAMIAIGYISRAAV